MKHIITRVTDEGMIIEIFDLEGLALFEEGSDKPTVVLKDLADVIARVSGLVGMILRSEHICGPPLLCLPTILSGA